MKRFHNEFLVVELIVIYYVSPLIIYFYGFFISPVQILSLLIIYIVLVLKLSNSLEFRKVFSFTFLRKKHLFYVQQRFFIMLILLTLFLLLYDYSLFLDLPLDKTYIWLGIVVIYPLFSVLPQEILYRTFFFERYKSIFTAKHTLVFASALTFSFGHIIFHNVIAILLTFFGGLMFAYTYHKRESLTLVSIEHTLYGVLVFTLGFGSFFYHGFVPS